MVNERAGPQHTHTHREKEKKVLARNCIFMEASRKRWAVQNGLVCLVWHFAEKIAKIENGNSSSKKSLRIAYN